jgi:hypothetical protein
LAAASPPHSNFGFVKLGDVNEIQTVAPSNLNLWMRMNALASNSRNTDMNTDQKSESIIKGEIARMFLRNAKMLSPQYDLN